MKSERVFQTALPVMLGYLPVGMTFGFLGAQQGLSIWVVVGFSMLVFAGSSQFVGLTFLAATSISYLQLFLTVWLINSRHFILSLAYLPYVKGWSLFEKLRFFPMLTDENFALLTNSQALKFDAGRAFHLSLLNYSTWAIGTLLGFWCGGIIPDAKTFGLDFALVGLFIGIIVLFIKTKSHAVSFLAALGLTFLFYAVLGWGKNSVLLAAILASILGWVCERQKS